MKDSDDAICAKCQLLTSFLLVAKKDCNIDQIPAESNSLAILADASTKPNQGSSAEEEEDDNDNAKLSALG